MPSFAGLASGMKIDKDNADRFKEVLDAGTFMMLKNGWFDIKTAPTMSFDVVPKYIEATSR
jgi:hypothetical protein